MENIEIDISHFYCLEYREGNKVLNVEIDFRERELIFGKSLIKKWEPPYSEEDITSSHKDKIYATILNYLEKRFTNRDIIIID